MEEGGLGPLATLQAHRSSSFDAKAQLPFNMV